MAENNEPVVVLYKSDQCGHCIALSKIWDTPTVGTDSVVTEIRKVYPKMRFVTVTAANNGGAFDENVYPKSLVKYARWFPMVILVPGSLWNAAMSKLGPKNDVDLTQGVQIMNGRWETDKDGKTTLKSEGKYSPKKSSEFGRWIKDAMEVQEFKNEQSKRGPIHSLISNNFKLPISQPVSQRQSKKSGDVCSMRVISRP